MILAFLPATVLAQSDAQTTPQTFDSAKITKKIAQAVVLIKVKSDTADLLATGFIISGDFQRGANAGMSDCPDRLKHFWSGHAQKHV